MEIDDRIRELLHRLGNGDEAAQDRLFEMLYAELHELAHRVRQQRAPEGEFRTTELIGAIFLKLRIAGTVRLNDANHFFSLAALLMRQALADEAARVLAGKRGGGAPHVTLDEERIADDDHERAIEVMEMEEAVKWLERSHPELARAVELRFYLECTIKETAQIMGRSARTIVRYDAEARGRLREFLGGDLTGADGTACSAGAE
jgi:RNA polymerase sigma factor (TIGR02999 family)